MSETRLPDQAPLPPEQPEPPPGQGSLIAGILLAWVTFLVGEALCSQAGLLAWWLPPVGILVWGIMLMTNGTKPRTGKGLLLGLASIFAVALLLVAACFGMLSHSNFN
ncbi:hypothetical protein [Dyella koreensis]|uniref:DUF4190 domain-containing protein n=1 Tax=Dyella koreensis TaxID=311235 RepID=A0ABW8K8H4_9GAMM